MALAINSFKIKNYCESEVCLFCMSISNLREITIYMLWKKEALGALNLIITICVET